MVHKALWRSVNAARALRGGGIQAAVRKAAAAPEVLSPWALWTLFGFARQIRWQERIDSMMQDDFGAGLAGVARSEIPAPPRGVPRQGLLGGSRVFCFHARGLWSREVDTRDLIDIDLVDGDLEHTSVEALSRRLRSLPGPPNGDMRLWELHMSYDTMGIACDELCELGLLEPRPSAPRLKRLSVEARAHMDELLDAGYQFGFNPDEKQLGMAALLGDWLRADQIAYAQAERMPWARALTRPRVLAQRARRRDRLLALLPRDEGGTVLTALVALEPPFLPDDLREAPAAPVEPREGPRVEYCSPSLHALLCETLAGPPDRRCLAAMDAIRHRDDASFAPSARALLLRLDLESAQPAPDLWALCAGYLLDHRLHVDDVVQTLPRLGDHFLTQAAPIAFGHERSLAVPLLHRALRSPLPDVRVDGAAILVLLDQPWSYTLLEERLSESSDPAETRECRVALRALKDPGRAAAAWEAVHPPRRKEKEAMTVCEASLRDRMDDLAQDVRKALAQQEAN